MPVSPQKMAIFRYHVVSTVLDKDNEALSYSVLCQKASEKVWELPDGSQNMFSRWTIDRWVRAYKKDGFEGLIPKVRNDKGISKKMTDEIRQAIADKVEQYPKLPCTVILSSIIEDGVIDEGDLSASTVSRFVRELKKNMDLDARLGSREKRRYEKSHINEVWYGDSTPCVYIDVGGRKKRTHILSLIDDASRMIVGFTVSFNDNTPALMSTVKGAVERYGVPEMFSFDNGSNYRSTQTSAMIARLGSTVHYNPPYTPTSKGKIERFFHTMQMQWQAGLSDQEMSSLEALQESLSRYIHKYNSTRHSAIKMTPYERFVKEASLIRYLPEEGFDALFLYEETRKVSSDGVLRHAGNEYETNYRYARQRVTIRYDHENRHVYISDNGKLIELQRLNKTENAEAQRRGFTFRKSGGQADA